MDDLLQELNLLYSEMGQRAITDYDEENHHDNEITNILEGPGLQVFYQVEKDWHYRKEERRWVPMNDHVGLVPLSAAERPRGQEQVPHPLDPLPADRALEQGVIQARLHEPSTSAALGRPGEGREADEQYKADHRSLVPF